MFGIRVGSKERDIVFPGEVCHVMPGQIHKKKVPPELTPKVVKFATRKPQERLNTIKEGNGPEMQSPVGRVSQNLRACLT
jgi:eukaryotic translation initiation factor 2C